MRRKKAGKRTLLIALFLLCAILWFVRYKSLNHRYHETDVKVVSYQMQEAVSFDSNILRSGNTASGCSLEVTDFMITNYPDYMVSIGSQSVYPTIQSTGVVTFILRNDSASETVTIEPAFVLHGVDELLPILSDDVYALNGKEAYTISLAPGASETLRFSFSLDSLSTYTLKHIDKYPIYFQITAYPETKDIQVNGL